MRGLMPKAPQKKVKQPESGHTQRGDGDVLEDAIGKEAFDAAPRG
jgi:hypothetical protein